MAQNNSVQLIVGAVIISAGLIASSFIIAGGQGSADRAPSEDNSFGNTKSAVAENVQAVSDRDHIRGNPNAKVSIIEFSDIECPFCARLHPTLDQILADYDGDVNWIYRHLPLDSIHKEARPAAVASECVNELAGNDAFWDFLDSAFANQQGLGRDFYIKEATRLGIDQNAFTACLSEGKHDALVESMLQDARASGGTGTPYSIIVAADGSVFPFSGALQYGQIKPIIDEALLLE